MTDGPTDGARATPDQMLRKHIFVVNGDPEFLDVVRELLQDERYNVTSTNYVPQTFDQVAMLQPALLIVDLVVGEQAGWDLLSALRQGAATQALPVIVVSTNHRLLERARENHVAFGGDSYLVKPFDIDDLLGLVTDLIGPA